MQLDQKIQEFLEKNPCGVISTDGPHGMESAAVHYTFDSSLTIYFNTRTTSRKFENIVAHPEVTFVVYQENPALTLQLAGTAAEITDLGEHKEQYEKLLKKAFAEHAGGMPIEKLHSMIRFIKITPTWARFGDFSKPIDTTFTLLVG